MKDFINMTNDDIMDLFGNASYKDRHIIRKLSVAAPCKGNDDLSVPSTSNVDTQDQSRKTNCVSSAPSYATPEHVPVAITEFSARELLEKKPKRGNASMAQKLFSASMKDAALAAKIWQKAPCLEAISSTKKNIFLDTARSCSPNFL